MGKKTEMREIEIKVSANKLWTVLRDESSELVPKLLPDEIAAFDILEGDGGVGTVKLLKFVPGVAPFSEQKEKLTEIDEEKRVVAFEIVGGPKGVFFESLKFKVEIKEKGDGLSLVKQTVEYEPIGNHTPTPALDGHCRILKAIEAHLLK